MASAEHPGEGSGRLVVLRQEAVDRGLQLDDRAEHAALQTAAVSVEENVSTAFSHEPEVGVKWKVQRGWRAGARTWVLVGA